MNSCGGFSFASFGIATSVSPSRIFWGIVGLKSLFLIGD